MGDYLGRARVIYTFRALPGAEYGNGWELLSVVRDRLWLLGAIGQSEGEGFSNESGYHILWQFPAGVSGPWWMGVLREGRWVHFRMDLGEQAHREAFLSGEVPDGVDAAPG